jgi:hypothetical protein
MPWILAAAAVGSALIGSQQQGQASGAGQRQSSIAGRQQQGGQAFTPTAQNAQSQIQGPYESLAGEMSRRNQGQPAQPPPLPGAAGGGGGGQTPGGGGGNTMKNINQAAQLGATLQSIFKNEQQAGAGQRSQALAARPQGTPMQGYQPTAMNQMDPRLQQLMMRR